MTRRIFALLLVLSGIVILIGAAMLRLSGTVPLYLTYSTVVAAVIIFVVSALILRTGQPWTTVGFVLGVIAIIAASNPAHLRALSEFGSSSLITATDITLVLGFYVLPVVYFVLFIIDRRMGQP